MISDLPLIMLYCLVLTIVIEAAAAYIIGLRSLQKQTVVLCVNLMTNPLLVSTGFCIMLFKGRTAYLIFLAAAEAAVVLAEGLVYKKVLKEERSPFLLSLILNLFSFGLGELLNRLLF